MKIDRFAKAMTSVVAFFTFIMASSCTNEEYDLSIENVDLKVTIFQEGISLPLGSTKEVYLEQLYSKLNGNVTELIQLFEGAYMFRKSDTFAVADDIAGVLSEVGTIDAVSFSESFSFALGNIDLAGLTVEGRRIEPEPIDLGELLEDFDIDDLNADLPTIEPSVCLIR